MTMEHVSWGTMPDGSGVDLFTMTSPSGLVATVTNYGATLVSLTAPDKRGESANVVLGFDSLESYLSDKCYLGRTVGRVANRIGNAEFELDDIRYRLAANNGAHHIHGGPTGFHSRLWKAVTGYDAGNPHVRMKYVSLDGEDGYPGNLRVEILYTLTDHGLRMDFHAETDKPTVTTLTNHAYFNLSGTGRDCLDHELIIPASRYLATDGEQIPTGELVDVAGTPMDFTSPQRIGARIDMDYDALVVGKGYDHFYVLDDESGILRLAAQVHEPQSGRVLEVHTTQPGVQFYSGNHLSGKVDEGGGAFYEPRRGFCLEAQGYPDAPNKNEFPTVALQPGTVYKQTTEYRLSVR